MPSSVKKNYEKYFEILEDYFGQHYEQMIDKSQTPGEIAYKSLKFYTDDLAKSICETFFEDLHNIDWNLIAKHIREQKGVKGFFFNPRTDQFDDLVRKTAMYADTVVFRDPLTCYIENQWTFGKVVPGYLLPRIIAWSVYMLSKKKLILCDISPPLVMLQGRVIARTPESFTERDNVLKEIIRDDVRAFASAIFGKKLVSDKELIKFLISQTTPKKVINSMKNPKLLVGKNGNLNELKKTIERRMVVEDERRPDMYWTMPVQAGRLIGFKSDEILLAEATQNFLGDRLAGINETLLRCGLSDCHPVTNQGMDWNILKWKFDHDSRRMSSYYRRSTHSMVLNALQLEDFKWLGNVPVDGIVKMRLAGELQDLRHLFSSEIDDIKGAKEDEFEIVVDQVKYNLSQAFRKHQGQVERLNKEYIRKYKFDVASLIVSGSISALAVSFPPLSYFAGILVGTGAFETLKDLLDKRRELKELSQKPVGLLFKARKNLT